MAAKKKSATKTSATKASKTVAKTAQSAAASTAVSKATTASQPAAKKKSVAKKTAAKKKVSKKLTSTPTATRKKTTAKKATTTKAATATTTAKKKTAAKKAPVKAASTRTGNSAAGAMSANGQFKTFTPYEAAKGEEYMSPEQLEHFRQILLNWKQSLMEEVDRTVGHMKSDATNFPDPNDRATQEEEFSLELRTRDRERKLIKKIDESIGKIDEDEYGFCDGCGVDIGIRRLEARPTANMCIECKTLEEIREKQIA
jgi:DnaK suppressor protein